MSTHLHQKEELSVTLDLLYQNVPVVGRDHLLHQRLLELTVHTLTVFHQFVEETDGAVVNESEGKDVLA